MIYCSTIGIYGNSFSKIINEIFQRQQINFSLDCDRLTGIVHVDNLVTAMIFALKKSPQEN